jgi:hypothetical protein
MKPFLTKAKAFYPQSSFHPPLANSKSSSTKPLPFQQRRTPNKKTNAKHGHNKNHCFSRPTRNKTQHKTQQRTHNTTSTPHIHLSTVDGQVSLPLGFNPTPFLIYTHLSRKQDSLFCWPCLARQ